MEKYVLLASGGAALIATLLAVLIRAEARPTSKNRRPREGGDENPEAVREIERSWAARGSGHRRAGAARVRKAHPGPCPARPSPQRRRFFARPVFGVWLVLWALPTEASFAIRRRRRCPCGAEAIPPEPEYGDPGRDWYCPEEDDMLFPAEAQPMDYTPSFAADTEGENEGPWPNERL